MSATAISRMNDPDEIVPAPVMKAIVHRRYGPPDTLRLEDIERPALTGDRMLIRVRAASVNAGDWRLMRGQPYAARPVMGVRRPKTIVPGGDLAGIVEAVGEKVTRFRPGDEVFGGRAGAFAEYVCGLERRFVPKPANLTFEQAAAIPIAGCTALQALRDHGGLQPGQHVLINGAAGGVGTFAVQIAKALGAHVTGGTRREEYVRSLGADRVIDLTREDVARGGRRYDLIVDIAGNQALRALRHALTPTGTLVIVGGGNGRLFGPLSLPLKAKLVAKFVSQRFMFFIAEIREKDLLLLSDMVTAGTLRPVIDRTYPLSQAPEAIRYVEAGQARGKVVVAIETDGTTLLRHPALVR